MNTTNTYQLIIRAKEAIAKKGVDKFTQDVLGRKILHVDNIAKEFIENKEGAEEYLGQYLNTLGIKGEIKKELVEGISRERYRIIKGGALLGDKGVIPFLYNIAKNQGHNHITHLNCNNLNDISYLDYISRERGITTSCLIQDYPLYRLASYLYSQNKRMVISQGNDFSTLKKGGVVYKQDIRIGEGETLMDTITPDAFVLTAEDYFLSIKKKKHADNRASLVKKTPLTGLYKGETFRGETLFVFEAKNQGNEKYQEEFIAGDTNTGDIPLHKSFLEINETYMLGDLGKTLVRKKITSKPVESLEVFTKSSLFSNLLLLGELYDKDGFCDLFEMAKKNNISPKKLKEDIIGYVSQAVDYGGVPKIIIMGGNILNLPQVYKQYGVHTSRVLGKILSDYSGESESAEEQLVREKFIARLNEYEHSVDYGEAYPTANNEQRMEIFSEVSLGLIKLGYKSSNASLSQEKFIYESSRGDKKLPVISTRSTEEMRLALITKHGRFLQKGGKGEQYLSEVEQDYRDLGDMLFGPDGIMRVFARAVNGATDRTKTVRGGVIVEYITRTGEDLSPFIPRGLHFSSGQKITLINLREKINKTISKIVEKNPDFGRNKEKQVALLQREKVIGNIYIPTPIIEDAINIKEIYDDPKNKIKRLYRKQIDAITFGFMAGGGIANAYMGTGKTLMQCCLAALNSKIKGEKTIILMRNNVHSEGQYEYFLEKIGVPYYRWSGAKSKDRAAAIESFKNSTSGILLISESQLNNISLTPGEIRQVDSSDITLDSTSFWGEINNEKLTEKQAQSAKENIVTAIAVFIKDKKREYSDRDNLNKTTNRNLLKNEAVKKQVDKFILECCEGLSKRTKKDIDVVELQEELIQKVLKAKILKDITKSSTQKDFSFSSFDVDNIIVDEHQDYKNLSHTVGVSGTGEKGYGKVFSGASSARAEKLFYLKRWVEKTRREKGARGTGMYFFSGTPLTNSVSEVYNVLRFVAEPSLKSLGCDKRGDFGGMFFNIGEVTKLNMGGLPTKQETLTGIKNLSKLLGLWGAHSIYISAKSIKEIGAKEFSRKYNVESCNMNTGESLSQQLLVTQYVNLRDGNLLYPAPQIAGSDKETWQKRNEKFLREVSSILLNKKNYAEAESSLKELVQAVPNMGSFIFTDKREEGTGGMNPLEICSMLRENSVHCGLLYGGGITEGLKKISGAEFTVSQKILACAEKTAEVYKKTTEDKGVQLIFCDTVNKKDYTGVEVYGIIKKELIKAGIKKEAIAFAQDYKDKKELKDESDRGNIRIIIGSSKSIGAGANLQKRCVRIAHLDQNWRPDVMEQKNSRGARPGNTLRGKAFEDLPIDYYTLNGSLDLYQLDMLQVKAGFITTFYNAANSGEKTHIDIGDSIESSGDGGAAEIPYLRLLSEVSPDKKFKDIIGQYLELSQRKEKLNAAINTYLSEQKYLEAGIKRINNEKGEVEGWINMYNSGYKKLTEKISPYYISNANGYTQEYFDKNKMEFYSAKGELVEREKKQEFLKKMSLQAVEYIQNVAAKEKEVDLFSLEKTKSDAIPTKMTLGMLSLSGEKLYIQLTHESTLIGATKYALYLDDDISDQNKMASYKSSSKIRTGELALLKELFEPGIILRDKNLQFTQMFDKLSAELSKIKEEYREKITDKKETYEKNVNEYSDLFKSSELNEKFNSAIKTIEAYYSPKNVDNGNAKAFNFIRSVYDIKIKAHVIKEYEENVQKLFTETFLTPEYFASVKEKSEEGKMKGIKKRLELFFNKSNRWLLSKSKKSLNALSVEDLQGFSRGDIYPYYKPNNAAGVRVRKSTRTDIPLFENTQETNY